jgi:hypothetical protein
MSRTFAAVIFALLTVTAPAHAAYVNAIEAVDVEFANGYVLTGEMEWANVGGGHYAYPIEGPEGLYLNGAELFGLRPPDGYSINGVFWTPPPVNSGFYNADIYAVVADLPNNLTVSDFYLNSTFASLVAGMPDGIQGVAGTVHTCSTETNCNVTPLPDALPMFGAALFALGGFAAWRSRWQQSRG